MEIDRNQVKDGWIREAQPQNQIEARSKVRGDKGRQKQLGQRKIDDRNKQKTWY